MEEECTTARRKTGKSYVSTEGTARPSRILKGCKRCGFKCNDNFNEKKTVKAFFLVFAM